MNQFKPIQCNCLCASQITLEKHESISAKSAAPAIVLVFFLIAGVLSAQVTGFSSIELGLDMDEVKSRLESDSNFLFRGDPDVTMLREPNESLIETAGAAFVDRGYFQFYDGRLFTIILELDTSRLDHYTMYTTLTERYGDPDSLDPKNAVWELEGVRISLERPLRVKYVDTAVFETILTEQRRVESLSRISRDNFLKQF